MGRGLYVVIGFFTVSLVAVGAWMVVLLWPRPVVLTEGAVRSISAHRHAPKQFRSELDAKLLGQQLMKRVPPLAIAPVQQYTMTPMKANERCVDGVLVLLDASGEVPIYTQPGAKVVGEFVRCKDGYRLDPL